MLFSDSLCDLKEFAFFCFSTCCVWDFEKFFFLSLCQQFNSVRARRDLWALLLTCDRMFTSKLTSGAEEKSERVTTLKTTDLLHTCTNKCTHGSFFMKWERNGPALFCLELFMSHRSATWVYMNSNKRSRDKEKQTIVKPDIHVPPKPKLPLWLQRDCGVWSQTYSNCNGIRECLNVFVCLGKLLSLYSWVHFPCWVTVKCVSVYQPTLTAVLDWQSYLLDLLVY